MANLTGRTIFVGKLIYIYKNNPRFCPWLVRNYVNHCLQEGLYEQKNIKSDSKSVQVNINIAVNSSDLVNINKIFKYCFTLIEVKSIKHHCDI
jgi:hypothetical protein